MLNAILLCVLVILMRMASAPPLSFRPVPSVPEIKVSKYSTRELALIELPPFNEPHPTSHDFSLHTIEWCRMECDPSTLEVTMIYRKTNAATA